jgi:hypothetical protein
MGFSETNYYLEEVLQVDVLTASTACLMPTIWRYHLSENEGFAGTDLIAGEALQLKSEKARLNANCLFKYIQTKGINPRRKCPPQSENAALL